MAESSRRKEDGDASAAAGGGAADRAVIGGGTSPAGGTGVETMGSTGKITGTTPGGHAGGLADGPRADRDPDDEAVPGGADDQVGG